MARSFPADVLVLSDDSLLHARLGRGKREARIAQAKSYRLPAGTFGPSVVTPSLDDESALTEAVRRLRAESGRWEKASLLLPDSWFRINIIELPSIPDKPGEALEMVRWSLKRTLPIAPESLRIAYQVLSRDSKSARILVLSAVDETLSSIERVLNASGIEIVLVEPVGINIWNAVTVRETETESNRLFVYVRDTDFTTAVFRGDEPLFIRSRNLSGDRTIQQELRLSASYLREWLAGELFSKCYVAGNRVDGDVHAALASEFSTEVRAVALRDYVEDIPAGMSGYEAELTACTGVFTA